MLSIYLNWRIDFSECFQYYWLVQLSNGINTCNHALSCMAYPLLLQNFSRTKKKTLKSIFAHQFTHWNERNTHLLLDFPSDHKILDTIYSSQRCTAFHTVIYVMLFNINPNAPIVCCSFASPPDYTLFRIQNTNCISIQMHTTNMYENVRKSKKKKC